MATPLPVLAALSSNLAPPVSMAPPVRSLEDEEETLFGFSTSAESLPLPPVDVSAVGSLKKGIPGGVATPPLGRAKRPKTVVVEK